MSCPSSAGWGRLVSRQANGCCFSTRRQNRRVEISQRSGIPHVMLHIRRALTRFWRRVEFPQRSLKRPAFENAPLRGPRLLRNDDFGCTPRAINRISRPAAGHTKPASTVGAAKLNGHQISLSHANGGCRLTAPVSGFSHCVAGVDGSVADLTRAKGRQNWLQRGWQRRQQSSRHQQPPRSSHRHGLPRGRPPTPAAPPRPR